MAETEGMSLNSFLIYLLSTGIANLEARFHKIVQYDFVTTTAWSQRSKPIMKDLRSIPDMVTSADTGLSTDNKKITAAR